MKKFLKYFFIFTMAFCCIYNVKAATTKRLVNISDSSKNVYSGPSSTYSKVGYAYSYGYYGLVDDKKYPDEEKHKYCKNDWYKIYYNGVATGFICGDDVEIVDSYSTDGIAPKTTCEAELSKLGFPSTYWGGLCRLKEKHPNWNFVVLNVDTDWKEVIEAESPCGWNLIYGSDANKGFIDTTCKKYDSGYVGILPSGIAYYMDPRNFFSERSIFQFQYLAYDNNFAQYYPSGVKTMLSGAEFYKYHVGLNKDFGSILTNVAKSVNVSPIFTSARILQELGSSTTLYNLYSGTGVYKDADGKEYTGYYNFYNIGVSDSCVQAYGTTYCGLSTAVKNGWNSLETAIQGGISTISKNYINRNQYTMYLQKFDVLGSEGRTKYTHQYMTNIAAPSSESAITYNAYLKMGILNQAFIFYIPVYKNMSATIDNSSNGAVNGGDNTSKPSSIPIPTIVTSSGYKYTSGYISGVSVGTSASALKNAIESVGGNSTVVITDAKGVKVTDGVLGTGYKISINNQEKTEVLEIVVKGDTSGDGVINALDLLQVQKNILGTYNLSGAYALAGDTSGDGVINALDLLQIQKYILGTFTIE